MIFALHFSFVQGNFDKTQSRKHHNESSRQGSKERYDNVDARNKKSKSDGGDEPNGSLNDASFALPSYFLQRINPTRFYPQRINTCPATKREERITGECFERDGEHGNENSRIRGVIVLQNIIRHISSEG